MDSLLFLLALGAGGCASVRPGEALPEIGKQNAARTAYARLRYEKLEPTWSDYRSVQFDEPTRLRAERDEKVRLLHQLEAGYSGVALAGDSEWGVCSLVRIGLLYLDLAAAFATSPDPRALPASLRKAYRRELIAAATPLQSEGQGWIDKGASKATRLGLHSARMTALMDDALRLSRAIRNASQDAEEAEPRNTQLQEF